MWLSGRMLLLWIGLGMLVPVVAASQERGTPRPSVGVALSGGGALGLAHIGVIRYFEEHRIPIDKIGGTSMGGLIGGLYAAGMNSSEIRAVAENADWNALLDPNPPFAEQPVVEKQGWDRTFGSLTLRFGRGFALPAGLNPGESLSLLLSRSTLGYSNVSDFDQLPTPFRCVATDLVSGDSVVLGKGSLPVAMRATMSLPGIFTPVKLDNMVLVDGGVLENIPVEAVRAMGSDTVIAVALETNKTQPDQIKTLSDVMRLTVSLAIAKNEQRSLAMANVVISVDTRRFSTTDYSRWKEIVDAGYAAAKTQQAQLARYELSPAAWEAYLADRRSRMRPLERYGRILVVASPDASFQKSAQAELRRDTKDRAISEPQLETVLSGMVAATAVPGAAYDWRKDDTGEEGYRVQFAARPNDQALVRVSARYAVSPGEPSRFGAKLSTVVVPKNVYKERFLTTVNVGYDPTLHAEFYKPFGGSQYFLAPQIFGGRTHFNSYTGPVQQSDTRDQVGGALYGGIGTWRNAQLRLGAEAGYNSFSRAVLSNGILSRSGGFAQPEMRWVVNNQDTGGLPSKGTRFEGAAGYFVRNAGDSPFFQSEYSTFRPVNRSVTFFSQSRTGTSFGRNLGYYDQFIAGDQSNMSAFRYQEFHANTLVTGGSGVILYGRPVPYVSSHPGLAFWYEAGRFDAGSGGWRTHQSSSVALLFPTRLGASGLELSFDEEGKARLRLMLGSF